MDPIRPSWVCEEKHTQSFSKSDPMSFIYIPECRVFNTCDVLLLRSGRYREGFNISKVLIETLWGSKAMSLWTMAVEYWVWLLYKLNFSLFFCTAIDSAHWSVKLWASIGKLVHIFQRETVLIIQLKKLKHKKVIYITMRRIDFKAVPCYETLNKSGHPQVYNRNCND